MESADVEDSERWYLPVMDVVDSAAGVRLSLIETCFSGHSMDNRLIVRVKVEAEGIAGSKQWVSLEDDLAAQVSGMGRITGEERWLIGQNERMEVVVLKF